jgi:hypothetical protein
MYTTDEMRRAFHSVRAPKNFGVALAEHSDNGVLLYLEVIADEQAFMRLDDQGKREAIEYMVKVKTALEDNGAVVQLSRRAVN